MLNLQKPGDGKGQDWIDAPEKWFEKTQLGLVHILHLILDSVVSFALLYSCWRRWKLLHCLTDCLICLEFIDIYIPIAQSNLLFGFPAIRSARMESVLHLLDVTRVIGNNVNGRRMPPCTIPVAFVV